MGHYKSSSELTVVKTQNRQDRRWQHLWRAEEEYWRLEHDSDDIGSYM